MLRGAPTAPDSRVRPANVLNGEVAEWSIAPHSKCGVRASAPGVRIPPSPPASLEVIDIFDDFPHYSHLLPHLTTGIAADSGKRLRAFVAVPGPCGLVAGTTG